MINFVGNKFIAFFISGLAFVVAVVALVVFGLKPSMDFTGGSMLELKFTANRPDVAEVRTFMEKENLGGVVVQSTGSDGLIIKTQFLSEEQHQMVLADLRKGFENDQRKLIEEQFETIGPAVSAQLRDRSIKAIIVVNLAIILFLTYSFRKVSKPVSSWTYGVVAVIALIHDVTITAGVFAFLGHFLGVEIDVAFVVALLTILGFSVHDTIVVFDRIRENLIRRSSENFGAMVNVAVNETLARSINTTLTTMLTLTALTIFGGDTIRYFALTLLIGIFCGAYSSIFVASPLLVVWDKFKRRKYA